MIKSVWDTLLVNAMLIVGAGSMMYRTRPREDAACGRPGGTGGLSTSVLIC